MERPVSGLLLLDGASWRLIASDQGAAEIFTRPNAGSPRNRTAVQVPEPLLNAIRNQTDNDQRAVDVSVPIGNRLFRCRCYMLKGDQAPRPAVVAVHFESHVNGNDSVRRLASEYHLTDREQEVLRGIALGFSTKEVATRMEISPNTVKSFVRLIMIKLGVTTRTGVILKLLEK